MIVKALLIEYNVIKPHQKRKYSKIKKTKVSQEFKDIYKYIELKYAKDLEKNRKNLIKSIINCAILFIVSFVLFIVLVSVLKVKTKSGIELIGMLCVSIVMYGSYKYTKCNSIYIENFKTKVVKNLLEYINPNMEYYPNGGNGIAEHYANVNFDDKKFNKIVTDDYIEGNDKNNTRIEMANILVTDINDKENAIYEGIFSVTQIIKKII